MSRLIDRFTPPLSLELFDKHGFFELYPFDGGGSFINHEIIGTVNDAGYTAAVVEKGALDEFGGYRNIDFLKFNFWRTIERTSWINRMYFIAPMANHARKTGNRQLAREVMEVLLRFATMPEYQAPPTQQATCDLWDEILRRRDEEYNALGPDFNAPVPYEWFDFQPASRILHGLYAMYFVKDMEVLSDEENQILEDLIFAHGQNIFWGEESHIPLRPGNHQALRGMALLAACAFFKGTRGTEKWLKTAENMVNYHITEDFLDDGMLYDLSPSYHFFESWITRDAIAIADNEHYNITPEARAKAAKAFALCCALRQPDGFSTVVSDGYPLDMSIFISSLKDAVEQENVEMLLEKARIAVKKDAQGSFLLFDCSPLLHKLSHHHGGKQAVSCFFKGEGFLMDPGCCSYDDEDFSEYFKQGSNHCSMLVDGKADSVLQGLYTWLAASDCQVTPWKDGVISSTMTSNAPGWENVSWERRLEFKEGMLEITDTPQGDREHEWTFVFPLRSGVECTVNGNEAVLESNSVRVRAVFPAPVEQVEGKEFKNFVKLPAYKLVMKIRGEKCSVKTTFKVIE